jgi:hypothetical protein
MLSEAGWTDISDLMRQLATAYYASSAVLPNVPTMGVAWLTAAQPKRWAYPSCACHAAGTAYHPVLVSTEPASCTPVAPFRQRHSSTHLHISSDVLLPAEVQHLLSHLQVAHLHKQ